MNSFLKLFFLLTSLLSIWAPIKSSSYNSDIEEKLEREMSSLNFLEQEEQLHSTHQSPITQEPSLQEDQTFPAIEDILDELYFMEPRRNSETDLTEIKPGKRKKYSNIQEKRSCSH